MSTLKKIGLQLAKNAEWLEFAKEYDAEISWNAECNDDGGCFEIVGWFPEPSLYEGDSFEVEICSLGKEIFLTLPQRVSIKDNLNILKMADILKKSILAERESL